MRALLALAAALLLPLAAAEAQPAGEERYIPSDLFGDEQDGELYERWLGESPSAIEEPVLVGDRLAGPLRRRFRLLATDHDGGGWAIRIDQRRSGGARVRAIEFAGGPSRRIRRDQAYDIDRDAVLEFERALALSNLRSRPAVTPVRDAAASGEICIPFGRFFFELREEAGSLFLMRDACDITPRLRHLVETLQPLRAR